MDDTVRHFAAIGFTVGDFNNDGINDVVFGSNGADNRDGTGNYVDVVILYGKGDGTFTYKWNNTLGVVAANGLPNAYIRGWNAGDYNNDGWEDILTCDGTNTVLRNNGNGTFTNVTALDAITGIQFRAAGFVDYNNDGFLDIYSFTGGTSTLLKNNGNSNHWIGFKPVGMGHNRSAIGPL